MTRGSGGHGMRRSLLAAIAFLLLTALLSTAPVAAHTSTRNDGNDSPGRLDIRSASVGHKGKWVVHNVRTYEGWTPQSLGNDSYMIVLLDKNFDDDFELCAFIFFAGSGLHGSLTNCGREYIRKLPVSKPSKAVAKIQIPIENVGQVYRWVVFSYWKGPPSRCSDVCFDAAPNRPPPIIHDLKPPVVTMPDLNIVRVWEDGTTSDFTFPFGVTDAHSGVGSWTIQRSPASGPAVWTAVLSGTGAGSKSPTIIGTPPGRFKFRVVAEDKQGNEAIGDPRYVFVPTDMSPSGPGVFSDTGVVETLDVGAYGTGYVPLDVGESYTLEVTSPTAGCSLVEFVGPGTGDWVVDVVVNGNTPQLDAANFAESPRQTLFSWCVSSTFPSTTFTFTVESGSGFGVDAVLI